MIYARLKMLDERRTLLSLYLSDLVSLVIVLALSFSILEGTGVEIISFLVAGIYTVALINIRRNRRKGVVRDFFKAKLRGRVIYDPRTI